MQMKRLNQFEIMSKSTHKTQKHTHNTSTRKSRYDKQNAHSSFYEVKILTTCDLSSELHHLAVTVDPSNRFYVDSTSTEVNKTTKLKPRKSHACNITDLHEPILELSVGDTNFRRFTHNFKLIQSFHLHSIHLTTKANGAANPSLKNYCVTLAGAKAIQHQLTNEVANLTKSTAGMKRRAELQLLNQVILPWMESVKSQQTHQASLKHSAARIQLGLQSFKSEL
jgi:hypothetical protein